MLSRLKRELHRSTMATTRTNLFPKSLTASIIFCLLFIAVSASVVPQQTPKETNDSFNKNVNANAQPTTSTPQANVAPRKNAKFISDFVSAHNMARLPLGHAPFKWNYTLAYFAKQWAKKRVDDCKLIHSYGPYGENLFWGGRTHWSPRAVVKAWVDEKAFYDPNSNSCAKDKMCGHYTQVIWEDTATVGCARVKCNNNKGLYVICNYDPPGNYINEHPFGNFDNAQNPQPPLPKPPVVVPSLPVLPELPLKKILP